MPNIKSAEKRMRQNAKRRTANRAQRSALRTAIKKAHTAVQEASPENAQIQLIQTISAIDKSAQKGLIHKNSGSPRIAPDEKAQCRASRQTRILRRRVPFGMQGILPSWIRPCKTVVGSCGY